MSTSESSDDDLLAAPAFLQERGEKAPKGKAIVPVEPQPVATTQPQPIVRAIVADFSDSSEEDKTPEKYAEKATKPTDRRSSPEEAPAPLKKARGTKDMGEASEKITLQDWAERRKLDLMDGTGFHRSYKVWFTPEIPEPGKREMDSLPARKEVETKPSLPSTFILRGYEDNIFSIRFFQDIRTIPGYNPNLKKQPKNESVYIAGALISETYKDANFGNHTVQFESIDVNDPTNRKFDLQKVTVPEDGVKRMMMQRLADFVANALKDQKLFKVTPKFQSEKKQKVRAYDLKELVDDGKVNFSENLAEWFIGRILPDMILDSFEEGSLKPDEFRNQLFSKTPQFSQMLSVYIERRKELLQSPDMKRLIYRFESAMDVQVVNYIHLIVAETFVKSERMRRACKAKGLFWRIPPAKRKEFGENTPPQFAEFVITGDILRPLVAIEEGVGPPRVVARNLPPIKATRKQIQELKINMKEAKRERQRLDQLYPGRNLLLNYMVADKTEPGPLYSPQESLELSTDEDSAEDQSEKGEMVDEVSEEGGGVPKFSSPPRADLPLLMTPPAQWPTIPQRETYIVRSPLPLSPGGSSIIFRTPDGGVATREIDNHGTPTGRLLRSDGTVFEPQRIPESAVSSIPSILPPGTGIIYRELDKGGKPTGRFVGADGNFIELQRSPDGTVLGRSLADLSPSLLRTTPGGTVVTPLERRQNIRAYSADRVTDRWMVQTPKKLYRLGDFKGIEDLWKRYAMDIENARIIKETRAVSADIDDRVALALTSGVIDVEEVAELEEQRERFQKMRGTLRRSTRARKTRFGDNLSEFALQMHPEGGKAEYPERDLDPDLWPEDYINTYWLQADGTYMKYERSEKDARKTRAVLKIADVNPIKVKEARAILKAAAAKTREEEAARIKVKQEKNLLPEDVGRFGPSQEASSAPGQIRIKPDPDAVSTGETKPALIPRGQIKPDPDAVSTEETKPALIPRGQIKPDPEPVRGPKRGETVKIDLTVIQKTKEDSDDEYVPSDVDPSDEAFVDPREVPFEKEELQEFYVKEDDEKLMSAGDHLILHYLKGHFSSGEEEEAKMLLAAITPESDDDAEEGGDSPEQPMMQQPELAMLGATMINEANSRDEVALALFGDGSLDTEERELEAIGHLTKMKSQFPEGFKPNRDYYGRLRWVEQRQDGSQVLHDTGKAKPRIVWRPQSSLKLEGERAADFVLRMSRAEAEQREKKEEKELRKPFPGVEELKTDMERLEEMAKEAIEIRRIKEEKQRLKEEQKERREQERLEQERQERERFAALTREEQEAEIREIERIEAERAEAKAAAKAKKAEARAAARAKARAAANAKREKKRAIRAEKREQMGLPPLFDSTDTDHDSSEHSSEEIDEEEDSADRSAIVEDDELLPRTHILDTFELSPQAVSDSERPLYGRPVYARVRMEVGVKKSIDDFDVVYLVSTTQPYKEATEDEDMDRANIIKSEEGPRKRKLRPMADLGGSEEGDLVYHTRREALEDISTFEANSAQLEDMAANLTVPPKDYDRVREFHYWFKNYTDRKRTTRADLLVNIFKFLDWLDNKKPSNPIMESNEEEVQLALLVSEENPRYREFIQEEYLDKRLQPPKVSKVAKTQQVVEFATWLDNRRAKPTEPRPPSASPSTGPSVARLTRDTQVDFGLLGESSSQPNRRPGRTREDAILLSSDDEPEELTKAVNMGTLLPVGTNQRAVVLPGETVTTTVHTPIYSSPSQKTTTTIVAIERSLDMSEDGEILVPRSDVKDQGSKTVYVDVSPPREAMELESSDEEPYCALAPPGRDCIDAMPAPSIWETAPSIFYPDLAPVTPVQRGSGGTFLRTAPVTPVRGETPPSTVTTATAKAKRKTKPAATLPIPSISPKRTTSPLRQKEARNQTDIILQGLMGSSSDELSSPMTPGSDAFETSSDIELPDSPLGGTTIDPMQVIIDGDEDDEEEDMPITKTLSQKDLGCHVCAKPRPKWLCADCGKPVCGQVCQNAH